MVQIIYACGFDLRLNVSMLAIKCIYAYYQMHICLLSNASMLAIKCIYACCKNHN